jgi:hypothetical protein
MAEKNFDNINETRAEEKYHHETTGGIGSLLQMLSFLPCIPNYYELPETPNIDQVHFFSIFVVGVGSANKSTKCLFSYVLSRSSKYSIDSKEMI